MDWRAAGAVLIAAVASVAWLLGGGTGLAQLLLFVAATVPGWPVGWTLFGRRHAAGWIGGALIGYVLTALGIWLEARMHLATGAGVAAGWAILTLGTLRLFGRRGPLVALPAWSRRDTAGLLLVLLLVPALVARPFSRIGAPDGDGALQYRAYFTADFLWHMALTDELKALHLPPANPYAGDQTLAYYWTYFLPPATVLGTGMVPGLSTTAALTVNALGAGLLFLGMILVAAWRVVPRIGTAATAVVLALLSASAEGTYVLWDLASRGRPLADVRHVNVDAITMWTWAGLTVDGLPRSLWYTPQHAMASALGLIGLLVAGSARVTTGAAALAGLALMGSVVVSPFLGGVFAVIYGVAAVANAWKNAPRSVVGRLLPHAAAAALTVAGVAWCVANQMLTGAGGAIRIGWHGNARHAPVVTLALALGPLLVPSLLGAWRLRRLAPEAVPAVAALAVGLALFYLVSLGGTDPVWVGWRAGQILLVTLPGLAATGIGAVPRPILRTALVAGLFVAGLPTTLIDAYNAQDVANRAMGPGFPWTVRITRPQQAAFRWIRQATGEDAIVQMEPTVRGRATWSLIPTFAGRRMAAGLPISLVSLPDYQSRSNRVRELYATTDGVHAWNIARELHVDYLYVDAVEREAFGEAAAAKFDRASEFFRLAFRQEDVSIYAVGK